MPFSFEPTSRAEFIAEAVTDLLATGGQAAVTMRAIAEATGLGQQSLAHHLGGRRRLMALSSHLSGRAHILRLDDRVSEDGTRGLIPQDERSRMLDRGWLSWTDLGRFDDHIGHQVAATEEIEAHVMARVLVVDGVRPASIEVEMLAATVRGLRAAVCRLVEPMPTEEANRVLEALVGLLAQSEGAAASAAERNASTIRAGSSAE